MKPLKYPLVRFYLKEIQKIIRHSPLSVVLIVGTLAELIMREMKNTKFGYEKHLDKLLERKLINEYQFKILNDIRIIRNRYVHINITKMMKKWGGLSILDGQENVTFVNEIILSSFEPEKEVPEFYSVYLKEDSKRILDLLDELITSF